LRPSKDILILRSPSSKTRGSREVLEAAGYQVRSPEACLTRPNLIVVEAETLKSAHELVESQLEELQNASVPILVLAQEITEKSPENLINVLPAIPDTRTLLQRVRLLTRTEMLAKYDFPEGSQPTATLRALGRIAEMNETSLMIETSIKLAPNEFVSIKGTGIEQLGTENLLIRRTKRFSRLTQGRHFMNECSVYYTEPGILMKIRKWIRGIVS